MNPKLLFFLLIDLLFNINQNNLVAQNLVPNGSFENLSNCHIGTIYQAFPWDTPTSGTPDVFNSCSGGVAQMGVPDNNFGYQYPHTGNGYAGAGFYDFDGQTNCNPFNYYIEYIQIQLDSPLIAHQKYCASFYVNHANRYYDCAIAGIGMCFSTSHTYIATECNLNYIPQITESSYVIDDSAWVLVYGQYIAQGGEKYIIIGNFNSESTTDTIHLINGWPANSYHAYYYIDDVNVHCCTCDSTTSLHAGVGEIKNEEDVEMYPNPATTSLTVALLKGEGALTIYNIVGEKVFTTKIINTQTEIDVGNLPKGMYFVEVRTEKGVRRKKVVKE